VAAIGILGCQWRTRTLSTKDVKHLGSSESYVMKIPVHRLAWIQSDPNILYAATYQRRRTPVRIWGGTGKLTYTSLPTAQNLDEGTNGLPEGGLLEESEFLFIKKKSEVLYISLNKATNTCLHDTIERRKLDYIRSRQSESWEMMSDWNPRRCTASQPCRSERWIPHLAWWISIAISRW